MKHIIFDLDLTLVDSTIAENERKNRNWVAVYTLIPKFILYEGLIELFNYIREHSIKVCIVSTAPHTYIQKVVEYFCIPCNYIVGYHDAKPIKPHPAPMLKALELLQVSSQNVVNFGDRVIDIQSGLAANIKSIACLWGSNETELLKNTFSYQTIYSPKEIIRFLE